MNNERPGLEHPWSLAKKTPQNPTTKLCSPPSTSNLTLPSLPTSCAFTVLSFPSTLSVLTPPPSLPGKTTLPFVPPGAPQASVYPFPVSAHFALNLPSGVVNPPSALFKSPIIGLTSHSLPPGLLTFSPTTNVLNASVGPVDQPCA